MKQHHMKYQSPAERAVVAELARYFPVGPSLWEAEGLTEDEAMAAFDLVAKELGCRDQRGKKLVHRLEDRARELANGGATLAIRNAARVLLSDRRTRWNALAVAARILRGATALRVCTQPAHPQEAR